MINEFYENTLKECEELENNNTNTETEMEQLEDAHRIELKVYVQKVKHLE